MVLVVPLVLRGSLVLVVLLVLVVGYPIALAARSPAKLVCLDFLVNNVSTIQIYLVYNHTSVLPFQKVIIIEK